MTRIRVVEVPPGEAPLWVRREWVGVELPLAKVSGSEFAGGVLGGDSDVTLIDSYAVSLHDAIDALTESSPSAADWWSKWSRSPFGRRFDGLLFPKSACESVI